MSDARGILKQIQDDDESDAENASFLFPLSSFLFPLSSFLFPLPSSRFPLSSSPFPHKKAGKNVNPFFPAPLYTSYRFADFVTTLFK